MNIVFLGSSEFAVPSLKALLSSGHQIIAVVTQPDRKKGRGLALGETAVKEIAKQAKLKIFQPDRINAPEAVALLRSLNPDLLVVIAYGQILSSQVLEIPKIMPVNLHASLLPKYRGAAPINWAIIKGEKTTGITVMRITEKMDAGPMIAQKVLEIDKDETALELEQRLSILGAELILGSLKLIEKENYTLIPQNENLVAFAPKLKKEDGLIAWSNQAQDIYNLIRGCLDWPGAFTYYKGKLLKIFSAGVILDAQASGDFAVGEIVKIDENGILVATGKGTLLIKELQPEGKRKMQAKDFILGHKLRAGEKFSKKVVA
jgi:methionyl-tRNA formyltransferase